MSVVVFGLGVSHIDVNVNWKFSSKVGGLGCGGWWAGADNTWQFNQCDWIGSG